jgi:hypothetical protein
VGRRPPKKIQLSLISCSCFIFALRCHILYIYIYIIYRPHNTSHHLVTLVSRFSEFREPLAFLSASMIHICISFRVFCLCLLVLPASHDVIYVCVFASRVPRACLVCLSYRSAFGAIMVFMCVCLARSASMVCFWFACFMFLCLPRASREPIQ